MSNPVRPHRRQPTRIPHPWDSLGQNTGVGCHFLLQCMKVKLLSRVWLLATPWTAAYHSSVHGIFQARVLVWGASAFSIQTHLDSPNKKEVYPATNMLYPSPGLFLSWELQLKSSAQCWIFTGAVQHHMHRKSRKVSHLFRSKSWQSATSIWGH